MSMYICIFVCEREGGSEVWGERGQRERERERGEKKERSREGGIEIHRQVLHKL